MSSNEVVRIESQLASKEKLLNGKDKWLSFVEAIPFENVLKIGLNLLVQPSIGGFFGPIINRWTFQSSSLY